MESVGNRLPAGNEPLLSFDRGTTPPLVAHVIFTLAVGGLENGLVNIINRTPAGTIRHAIICITTSTPFENRIESPDVQVVELRKAPGKGLGVYWRFWRALRRLRPDIVHTRNVNSLEFQLLAFLAGVKIRIHGEHGWDVHDLHGNSRKYRWLRKVIRPFVSRFVVVSADLQHYLMTAIAVPDDKVLLIRNGVDTGKFQPADPCRNSHLMQPDAENSIVIAAVGRLREVKNHRLLVDAFLDIIDDRPELRRDLRLLVVGDGPHYDELRARLSAQGAEGLASMPGASENIAEILRGADIFVSPSKNEGISNTILEAMAAGLPIVATNVGGTPEIVMDEVTGLLVKSEDEQAMATAILRYVDDPELRRNHGQAGRRRAQEDFDLDLMVERYLGVYQQCLAGQGK
jgi:sugar transferase (PEP-CTERM/EpsH1 system associated)